MNSPTPASTPATPIHLWIVGVLGLLWSCMGAFDYTMTETHNETYLKAFTPEMLAYVYSIPAWAIATWALAVWGGVVGSVLLLLRKRIAVPVYLVSLISFVLTSFHNYVLTDGAKVMGGNGAYVFAAVIFAICVGLWLYARAQAAAGVLR